MSLGRGRGIRKGIKIRTNRIDTIQNKRMHDTQKDLKRECMIPSRVLLLSSSLASLMNSNKGLP